MFDLRRLTTLLLSIVLLLPAAAATHAAKMVSVARGRGNMRSGPGLRHDAEWVVSRGYPLAVQGRKGDWLRVRDFENGDWIKVRHERGTTGWVARRLTWGW